MPELTEEQQRTENRFWKRFISGSILGVFTIIGLGMWGCPQYNVWQQGLGGQAELKRAVFNRQITVEEARATLESADLLNKAEVLRARGVAEANEIIAGGLGGPQGYLRYLYIQQLAKRKGDTIYIPTEAGLPILEATRMRSQ